MAESKKDFDEVFEDVTKHGTKIKTDEYHSQGKYQIIDQGQDAIAGYTDLEDGVFRSVPAIVFGDHTRIVKYVDKPFFLGADGVKVLRSRFADANYRYLYYALRNVKIPDTGYNRHFKWLKEAQISYPSAERQSQIVSILDGVSSVIGYYKQQLQKLDELVKARFVELFGMINEDVPLSYYIASLNAGKSLAGEEENPNKVLKTGAVTYDYFDATQIKNLPMDYEPQEDHRVKAGDVIISRMNTAELVGAAAYVWDVPEHLYLPDRLWRAEIKDTANPIFVWQVLIQSSTKKSIRSIASGTSGSMKNISKPSLLGIRVVKAPIEFQEQFATFVEQTDKSKVVIQKALNNAQLLFDSLMQQYLA